jgi:hypothetical protein
MGYNILNDEPIKLTINDVKNEKMRKTLKMTGIFDKWNVYIFERIHDNRQPIYITKDELHKGDRYHGERISDSDVNKNYGRGERRYLKTKGVKNISELEPQFWVVCAVHGEKHEEMNKERDERYEAKTRRALEKGVNKAIKEDDILGRSSQFIGDWNYNPIAFKVVSADRVDLMKKLIDGCIDDEEIDKMINNLIDHEGWNVRGKLEDHIGFMDNKFLPETIKSVEMAKLLTPYVMKDVDTNKRWIDKIKNEEVKKYFQEINWES